MTITITISYWTIPLIITAASFVWAITGNKSKSNYMDFDPLIKGVAAVIISLVAWLIFAAIN